MVGVEVGVGVAVAVRAEGSVGLDCKGVTGEVAGLQLKILFDLLSVTLLKGAGKVTLTFFRSSSPSFVMKTTWDTSRERIRATKNM